MSDVHILGVGMTRFGKHPDRDAADLGAEALRGAVSDSGIRSRGRHSSRMSCTDSSSVSGPRSIR